MINKFTLNKNIFDSIPIYILKIAEELEKHKFEAYLVGGSLRDILLGKIPSDFDIATNAYPEEILKIFPKSVPTGAKFGTVTVVVSDEKGENFSVQVTTYRSEADYFGGRWPSKVEFARNIEEDLSRRDFTINALALNLQKVYLINSNTSTLILDLFGGINDLNAKVIRAVGNPFDRLTEDGLRAVRACRLAAQLEFNIEEKTFEAIKQTNHVTAQVSIERFREEFEKLLYKSSKPSIGIKLMKETGILKIFIPELLEGVNITQPEFHVDDVFEHSLKTLDFAPDDIKLAALFHDIGKPRCMTIDEKGVHFYSHDVVGAEMTENILKRLRFPNHIIEETKRLVRWHMFYYPSADWRDSTNNQKNKKQKENKHGWSDGAIRRLINNVGGDEGIDKLIKLRIADATANPKSDFHPSEIEALSERISEVREKSTALKISDLDITGEDLIQNFDLKPGKIIGDILKYLLEKVLDEPSYNKKIDLLRLAKNYIKKIEKRKKK